MTEQELQRALAKLSNRLQVAFLVACIEHVYPVCGRHETVRRAIELGWTFTVDGSLSASSVAEIVSSLDETLDEDSPTELVHVAAAAEIVVTSVEAPNDVVVQVLNNLEAAIDVVDPEAQSGILEEREWQERALRIVENSGDRSVTRETFDALTAERMGWLERLEAQSS